MQPDLILETIVPSQFGQQPFLVVAGGSTHASLGPLTSTLAQQGPAFGLELGAISMALGVADVKPVTVVDFFNAKLMVHLQTPLPNMR